MKASELFGRGRAELMTGYAVGEWIWGGDADDLLEGGAGDDRLMGAAGSDTLIGGGGKDELWGKLDTSIYDGTNAIKKPDTARYDVGPVVDLIADLGGWEVRVVGMPEETDWIYGVENFWAGGGDDSVSGDGSGNELRGGRGRDTLSGGGGDDTLVGEGERDRFDGGDGLDTAVYAENTTPVQIDLAAGTAAFAPKPWAIETLVSIEGAVTGSGADLLRGTAGTNVLDGGEGADTIEGRGGADVASFASHGTAVEVDLVRQRAVVTETGVTDVLSLIEGATGGGGDDRLLGNRIANRLDGGDGNDLLNGAAGDDTFLLSAGEDTLHGGAGTDTLVWAPTYFTFYELHYKFEIGYIDSYSSYSGDTAPDCLVDLRNGLAANYTTSGTSHITAIENVVTGVGNDVVVGSHVANVITVGHGANYVDGGGGADRITGSTPTRERIDTSATYSADHRDGHERLLGGSGDDTIVGGSRMNGGAGDDRLVAGWNQNHLTGGSGADTFRFSAEHEAWSGVYDSGVFAQSGRVLDFDGAEGDRVVIDWTRFMGPGLPEFAGYGVTWDELGVRQYSIVGDTLHVGLGGAHHGNDAWTEGIVIVAPGITAEDVFFI
jgi:Ca2+-binding RTX toxin-like protein